MDPNIYTAWFLGFRSNPCIIYQYHKHPVFQSEYGKNKHPPSFSGWWLNQPIWKICSSNWTSSPIFGVKIKNSWNHHLVFVHSLKRKLRSSFLRMFKSSIRKFGRWTLGSTYGKNWWFGAWWFGFRLDPLKVRDCCLGVKIQNPKPPTQTTN